jgi:lysophospholipase L1-like esterase
VKIIGFGDSITAGGNVREEDKFLSRIAAAFGCKTMNAGVSGGTSAQGVKRLEQDVLGHKPDICIVAFGMNDHVHVASGRPRVPLPEFRQNLTYLCDCMKSVGIVPILCTVHPIIEGDENSYYYKRHPQEWYMNPAGAQAWIDMYNREIREVAHTAAASLADIALHWQRELDRGGQLADLLGTIDNSGKDDGVHPTAAGQKLYADCLTELIIRHIKYIT